MATQNGNATADHLALTVRNHLQPSSHAFDWDAALNQRIRKHSTEPADTSLYEGWKNGVGANVTHVNVVLYTNLYFLVLQSPCA